MLEMLAVLVDCRCLDVVQHSRVGPEGGGWKHLGARGGVGGGGRHHLAPRLQQEGGHHHLERRLHRRRQELLQSVGQVSSRIGVTDSNSTEIETA
jgi:hypothetical protein